jgi:hypothetical protein
MVSTLGGGRVESLADVLRAFNYQNGVTVANKAFDNRLARAGFATFMQQMPPRLLAPPRLGGRHSDEVVAWPTAEISFIDPRFATTIVHGVGPGEPGFEEAYAKTQKDTQIWDIAGIYGLQDVIRPEQTRDYLIRMLDVYRLRKTNGVGKHLMRTWPTSY